MTRTHARVKYRFKSGCLIKKEWGFDMVQDINNMAAASGKALDKDSNPIQLVSKAGLLTANNNCERLNAGKLYVATHIFEDIANTASGYLLFVTGENTAKSTYLFRTSGETVWRVYENPTVTDNGTLATIANRNLTSDAVTNETDVYHTPAITSNGTLLTERRTCTSGPFASGDGGDEYSLKVAPNSSVLYQFESLDSGGDNVSVAIDWSEED